MPRYLVFADLQATEGREMCHHNPQLPLQRWRVDKFLTELDELCAIHKIDGLIDLGDTSDDRTDIPMPTLSQLARLAHDSRGAIKLIGNHEQYHRDQSVHTGELFHLWNVVHSRATYKLGGCYVIAAAYTDDYKDLSNWLEVTIARAPKDMPIVILGHWDVVGAKMTSGQSLYGVPKAVLEKATVTLLGHIHKPQVLGQSIYYVGSPFQQDFGEAGEEKRIGLLELENSEVSLSWIPLNNFPHYYACSLTEFEHHFDCHAESRFIVELKSPAELAKFNALQHKHLATKKLLYGESLAMDAKVKVNSMSVNANELLTSYVKRQPLTGVETGELVAVGLELFGI